MQPAKRVTIMLDDDLDRRLRLRQAKLITQTQNSVSFSSVINKIIRGELKL